MAFPKEILDTAVCWVDATEEESIPGLAKLQLKIPGWKTIF